MKIKLFQTFEIDQPKIYLTLLGILLLQQEPQRWLCHYASVLKRSGPDSVGGEGKLPKSLWINCSTWLHCLNRGSAESVCPTTVNVREVSCFPVGEKRMKPLILPWYVLSQRWGAFPQAGHGQRRTVQRHYASLVSGTVRLIEQVQFRCSLLFSSNLT